MAALQLPSYGPRMADTPPSEAALREAALSHLARYATTSAGLVRVLDRRIDRWARAAGPEREQIRDAKTIARTVVAKLAELGAVDDAAFALSRARSLTRTGRSRRAIAAHLAERGIAPETAAASLPTDAETELAAAVAFTLRRRIGPFRRAPVDQAGRMRELGMLPPAPASPMPSPVPRSTPRPTPRNPSSTPCAAVVPAPSFTGRRAVAPAARRSRRDSPTNRPINTSTDRAAFPPTGCSRSPRRRASRRHGFSKARMPRTVTIG